MSEKRGNTVKLLYNFNTAGLLEICIKGTWFRASAREFRSFDGKRRITEPDDIKLGEVVVPMKTYYYTGPVFMFETNIEVEPKGLENITTSEFWEQARQSTKKRGI